MIEESKKEIQLKKKTKDWYVGNSSGDEDYKFIIQGLSSIVSTLKDQKLSLTQVMNIKSEQVAFKMKDVKSLLVSYRNEDDEEMKDSDVQIKTFANKIKKHVLDVGKGYRLEVLLKLFSDAGYKITTHDRKIFNKDVIQGFEKEIKSTFSSPTSGSKLKTRTENGNLDLSHTLKTMTPLTPNVYYSSAKVHNKPSSDDSDHENEEEKQEETQNKLVWRNANISPTDDMYAVSGNENNLPLVVKQSPKSGGVEEDDDGEVYPLSIKYDKKQAKIRKIVKYSILVVFLVFIVLFIFFSLNSFSRKFPVRLGYFADKVTEEDLSLNGITELAVNTKNCVLYLLENPDSRSEVELYVSAGRSTGIDTSTSGAVQTIKIHSDIGAVE